MSVNHNIVYRSLICPCCLEHSFIEIHKRTRSVPTNNGHFYFCNTEGCCPSCGITYVNPIPEENSLYNYYRSKFINVSDEPDYNLGNRLIYIENLIGPGSTVLEIGSGDGRFLAELKIRGMKTLGIDPIACPDHNPASQHNISIETNIVDSRVDVVVMNHVLEHIPSPVNYLNNLRNRVLANDSFLIIEVPNLEKYTSYKHRALTHEHVYHYTRNTLENILIRSGFRVIEEEQKLLSRSIGLMLLARPTNQYAPINKKPVSENIKFFKYALGQDQKKSVESRYFIRQALTKTNKMIGLWGANAIMEDLVEYAPVNERERLIGIDRNATAKRVHFHSDSGQFSLVHPTKDICDRDVELVVICAVSWSGEIINELRRYGVSEDRILIAPY